MTKLLRTLWKNRISTLINLVGLSSAFAISFLILIYAKHEGDYDDFHENSDRIYRLNTIAKLNGETLRLAKNSLNAGPLLAESYPAIERYVRFVNSPERTVKYGDHIFNEKNLCYTDPEFLAMFNFELLAGSDNNMNAPNNMLIDKDVAIKYFGTVEAAVGETLEVGGQFYLVNGVLNLPTQTHLTFDIFISVSTLPESFTTPRNQDYLWMTNFTYVTLRDGVSKEQFEEQLSSFYERTIIPFTQANDIDSIVYGLQQVANIHINNSLRYDYPNNIDAGQLTIFTTLAFAILLIASVNYMNLFTAQVSKRTLEVGIKKTFGASNMRLVRRFISETLIIAFAAFAIALFIMYASFPGFNSILALNLEAVDALIEALPWMLLLVVVLGVLSGIYPALYITGFSPLEMMVKNSSKRGGLISKTLLRKILVTFQLAVSSALIITIVVVSSQLDFIFNKDVGFNKESIYVVDIPNDRVLASKMELIREDLMSAVNINRVATSSHIPGKVSSRLTFDTDQSGTPNIIAFNFMQVNSDFLDLLDIDIQTGRNFLKNSQADVEGAFLVNETFAKNMGWDEPINKQLIAGNGQTGRIAGVFKDFNHASLHNPIEPLILFFREVTTGFQLIKVNTSDLPEAVNHIETTWKRFAPGHPFNGFFLDDSFDQQYNKEARLKSMFTFIGMLAIIITSLGLIGMTFFTIERKLKEISIRRVIGASSQSVIRLLSKEYIPIIIIANLISIPVAIYGLNQWLESFAFKTEVSLSVYILVFLSNALLVLLIILPMVMNVLRRNLIHALRIE